MSRIQRYLRAKRPAFGQYQLLLTQAGITTTYDRYLARGSRYTLGLLAGAIVLGVGLAATVSVPTGLLVGGAGVASALLVFLGWYLYPRYRRRQRQQEITAVLPYALVLMETLARSGMSLVEITALIADSEEVYGELAVEFGRLQRDVTYFGSDMLTAVEQCRLETPCEELGGFLTDLSVVMQSQTAFETFVADQSRDQLDRVRAAEAAFLDRLASLAQVYIVAVFVAPIFVLVLLVLLSFGGGNTLGLIYVVAYLYPPVAIAVSVGALDVLRRDIALPQFSPGVRDRRSPPPEDDLLREYLKRRRSISRVRPLATLSARPWTALLVSVPLALLGGGLVGWATGIDPLAVSATRPVQTTAGLVGLGLVAVAPFALLEDRRRRRRQAISERIPAVCDQLADAVGVGMTPTEACRQLATNPDGPLEAALGYVADEGELTGDAESAFMSLAHRLDIPELTLTLKPVADGFRATGDLSAMLSTLADTAEARQAIAAKRRRTMDLYGIVVVLGLGAFLAVAVFLNAFFLPQLSVATDSQGFVSPPPISALQYQTILFHAGLVQAAGNGLVIGKLREDRLLSGLRYSLGFVVVVTVAFLLL